MPGCFDCAPAEAEKNLYVCGGDESAQTEEPDEGFKDRRALRGHFFRGGVHDYGVQQRCIRGRCLFQILSAGDGKGVKRRDRT